MHGRFTPTRLLVVAALLPLVACGTDNDEEMPEEEAAPAAEMAPQPTTEAPSTAMGTETIDLMAKNGSGVSGTATARHEGESVVVDVNIQGASQEGSFPAHIHAGSCPNPGGVEAPLESLTVSGGTGSSTTTLAADQVPIDQPSAVQVHDPSGQPIACGDLTGHGAMGDEGAMEGDTTGM